jgi:hypothetical protein
MTVDRKVSRGDSHGHCSGGKPTQNHLLILGEFIAVTLQCNPVPRSGHSNYIATLTPLFEPSGSVQQLVFLVPANRSARRSSQFALGGLGYESFR